MPKLAGGAGSLLPPGPGRRHAHPDGGRLGEPGTERGGNHRSGAGLNGARAGGRQAGGQRAAILQRKEGHPDVGRGSAQRSQRSHSALTLNVRIADGVGFLVTVLITFFECVMRIRLSSFSSFFHKKKENKTLVTELFVPSNHRTLLYYLPVKKTTTKNN